MEQDICDRTFKFAKRVTALCRSIESTPGISRRLADQLFRAGTSIGANIEEAQGSQSDADFLNKCSIACKEAREAHYWLRLLAETGLVRQQRLTDIIREANEIIAILTTIIRKVRANRKRKKNNA